MKNKVIKSLVAFTMLFSVFATFGNNDKTIHAASTTDPALAPADWAFEESSIPLHDAILNKYPAVDTNTDGYISIPEANAMTGALKMWNTGADGTINGIENFKNITELHLQGANFSGNIPAGIGNMTNLTALYLQNNNFTGSLPKELGQLSNMTILEVFNNPNLDGLIPEEFSGLTSLTWLTIRGTQIEGPLPTGFINLTNLEVFVVSEVFNPLLKNDSELMDSLTQLDLDNANTSLLNIPASVVFGYTISSQQAAIEHAQALFDARTAAETKTAATLNEAKNGLAEDVSQVQLNDAQAAITDLPDSLVKTNLQADLDIAKSLFSAKSDVNDLFTDNTQTALVDSVTQDIINTVRDVVNNLIDGTTKSELNDSLDVAQNLLDATNKVNDLFNDDKSDLVNDVTQDDIDEAADAVAVLPDGSTKTGLEEDLANAQELLDNRNDAKNKVEDLFDNDGNIKDAVDQDRIDEAQDAIDKLPEGSIKEDLQDKLDDAQEQLNNREDAKNKVEDLLNDNKDGLKPGVDQDQIDEAQEAINKLPEGSLKDELQEDLDLAQEIFNKDKNKDGYVDLDTAQAKALLVKVNALDSKKYTNDSYTKLSTPKSAVEAIIAREEASVLLRVVHPSQAELDAAVATLQAAYDSLVELEETNDNKDTSTKTVTVVGTSTATTSSVSTGDETNNTMLYAMLVSSIALLGFFAIRRKETK